MLFLFSMPPITFIAWNVCGLCSRVVKLCVLSPHLAHSLPSNVPRTFSVQPVRIGAVFVSHVDRRRQDFLWAPCVPSDLKRLTVTLEIIAILDRKNGICLSRAVCHQWAFVLAIDRLLGRTQGLMDAQQTDSASPASRPAKRPSWWDVKSGEATVCSSNLHIPASDLNLPRCWPSAASSRVSKWPFISKHGGDYCSLAPIPLRR